MDIEHFHFGFGHCHSWRANLYQAYRVAFASQIGTASDRITSIGIQV